jgi:hypothetical protein
MSLFGNSFTAGQDSSDLFDSLASSQDSLIQSRRDAGARQTAQDAKDKTAAGGFASTLGALGGLASVIPGGQIIGAGLGVLGAIIGLFK